MDTKRNLRFVVYIIAEILLIYQAATNALEVGIGWAIAAFIVLALILDN